MFTHADNGESILKQVYERLLRPTMPDKKRRSLAKSMHSGDGWLLVHMCTRKKGFFRVRLRSAPCGGSAHHQDANYDQTSRLNRAITREATLINHRLLKQMTLEGGVASSAKSALGCACQAPPRLGSPVLFSR